MAPLLDVLGKRHRVIGFESYRPAVVPLSPAADDKYPGGSKSIRRWGMALRSGEPVGIRGRHRERWGGGEGISARIPERTPKNG